MENTTTPMMAQWEACKAQADGALLLFRLGDFYEAFCEDAIRMSKELGLTLTARQGTPMCGVPAHTSEAYIDKLIAKGYKVAVAEQTEDPKSVKGLLKREIVRIVTPGTIVTSQLLADKKNNYFASIAQVGTLFGLAALDVTTGEFRSVETETVTELIDELARLRPAELLASSKFKTSHPHFFKELSHGFSFVLNEKEEWRFDPKLANDSLLSHFKAATLDAFGLKGQFASIAAAGALIGYLKQDLNFRLDHVEKMSSDCLQNYLALDRSTLRNLELVEGECSLLSLLDQTETPMGGRLLCHWIKQPLLSLEEIEKRQKAIEELRVGPDLSQVRDLERLMMKISARYGSPRDLLGLGLSLSKVDSIRNALSEARAPLLVEAKEKLSDGL